MRLWTATLLTIILAAALASCGEEDAQLLPGETAREITANLETVRLLADQGDCAGAEGAAEQVSAQIEELTGVEPELKQALRQGATRLNQVVATCVEAPEEEVETLPEPVEEAPDKEKKVKKDKAEDDEGEDEPEEEKPAEEESEAEPSLPPQANGNAKGHEQESGGEGESGEAPSGGISPGSSVEGGP